MTWTFLAGLALGLGLIIPIGAQNVFVFGQGLAVGLPRSLWAVLAAGCCDTILILLGALGVSTLLEQLPGLREVLLVGGAIFLTYLGIRSLRSRVATEDDPASEALGPKGIIARTAAVSLFNPHAILDTIGVLGVAIAAQAATERVIFAAGVFSASWIWFIALVVVAATLRDVLTPDRRVWLDRVSGVILLGFAVMLVTELW